MGLNSGSKNRQLFKRASGYDKLSHKEKILMLKKVFCDRCSINETADSLKINYSTAKTLIRRFKTRGEKLNLQFFNATSLWFASEGISKNRCTYQNIWPQTQQGNDSKHTHLSSESEGEHNSLNNIVNNNKNQKDQFFNTPKIMIIQQVLFKE